jgi:hypothetical protein
MRADNTTDASRLIDDRIKELGDWRGETLCKVREIIKSTHRSSPLCRRSPLQCDLHAVVFVARSCGARLCGRSRPAVTSLSGGRGRQRRGPTPPEGTHDISGRHGRAPRPPAPRAAPEHRRPPPPWRESYFFIAHSVDDLGDAVIPTMATSAAEREGLVADGQSQRPGARRGPGRHHVLTMRHRCVADVATNVASALFVGWRRQGSTARYATSRDVTPWTVEHL